MRTRRKVGCLGYTAAGAITSAVLLELFPWWALLATAAALTFVGALLGELAE